MTPSQIAAHRATLGLSTRDFEQAIGYNREGKTTKALESGEDERGLPFKIAGAAEKALLYLLAVKQAYELVGKCDSLQGPGLEAEQVLLKALPEALR
jgi:hypothetical protein